MKIGIIGGSGVVRFMESTPAEEISLETPFGKPSAPIYRYELNGHSLFFLARHGDGHSILPSELNSRANIYGLKTLGVEAILSISAVGSLKQSIVPGHLVLPDQYLDFTKGRPSTFLGGGVVAHVPFAEPTCFTLRQWLANRAEIEKIPIHVGGTYVCMEGPQFSSKAESHFYRSLNIPGGVSVIGMTAMPEAKLAREAGICYQTVALATDYDCWNEDAPSVTSEAIQKVIAQNVSASQRLIAGAICEKIPACQVGCAEAIRNAVITPKEKWPEQVRPILATLLGAS